MSREMEMRLLSGYSGGGRGPISILDQCRDLDLGIDATNDKLGRLRQLQNKAIEDTDESPNSIANRQLESLSEDIFTSFSNLTGDLRAIVFNPESRARQNASQVSKVEGRLKAAMENFTALKSDYHNRLEVDQTRRYRIVFPNATEAEVQAAVQDQTGSVFNQALLRSDRRAQTQSVLRAVEERHQAIQRIEKQMIELEQLFTEMNNLVHQQGTVVETIEHHGEDIVDNTEKANVELEGATKLARSTRKKKWWCLLICILIIVIIAIILVIIYFVNKKGCDLLKAKNLPLTGICAIIR